MDIGIELIVLSPFGTPFAVLTVAGERVAAMNHYYEFVPVYRVSSLTQGEGSSNDRPVIFGRHLHSSIDVVRDGDMTEDAWRDWEVRTLLEHAGLEIDEAVVKRLVEEARGWVYDFVHL